MNITATGAAEVATVDHDPVAHGHQGPLYKMAIGAIGIVFGDIGTSPIYSFRETFAGHHPLAPNQFHIHAVLSMPPDRDCDPDDELTGLIGPPGPAKTQGLR